MSMAIHSEKISFLATQFLHKHRSEKIVFTNGCFDILHRGHIAYLNEARSLGDILFVGLNSDVSIKKLKGPQRPIHTQDDRKFILENLRCIDFVEIFDQETPVSLIQAVRPQVLVKGGDWKIEEIVGSDFVTSYGGEVRALQFIPGHSTTSIIRTIQEQKS